MNSHPRLLFHLLNLSQVHIRTTIIYLMKTSFQIVVLTQGYNLPMINKIIIVFVNGSYNLLVFAKYCYPISYNDNPPRCFNIRDRTRSSCRNNSTDIFYFYTTGNNPRQMVSYSSIYMCDLFCHMHYK